MGEALFLVPIALILGLVALATFLWNLSSGQYEDLEGAAERVLYADGDSPAGPNHETPGSAARRAAR